MTSRSALRDWVERDKIRPVVVTSPHPPDECLRRLAKVTTGRLSGWYLDSRTATLPDPLFHGQVGPSQVRIVLFRERVTRRHRQDVWFDARVDPSPDGGTVLTGTVGSWSGSTGAGMWAAGFFGVAVVGLALSSLVTGVVITASGHFNLGVGVAIGLPVIVAVAVAASRGNDGLEAAEDKIPGLLRRINGVLDSTSVTQGPQPGA